MGERVKRKFMKAHAAWADVGSNGGIFEFAIGKTADLHPNLMHVYSQQVEEDLVPVYVVMRSEWRDKTEELRELRRKIKALEKR